MMSVSRNPHNSVVHEERRISWSGDVRGHSEPEISFSICANSSASRSPNAIIAPPPDPVQRDLSRANMADFFQIALLVEPKCLAHSMPAGKPANNSSWARIKR